MGVSAESARAKVRHLGPARKTMLRTPLPALLLLRIMIGAPAATPSLCAQEVT